MTFRGSLLWSPAPDRGWDEPISLYLAAAGAEVLVNDIDAERAESVVSEIASEGKARTAVFDVTDWASVRSVVDEVGPVDILVNNAGNAGPEGWTGMRPFHETEPEDWGRFIDVNLYGVMHCVRAALPGMIGLPDGRIITVISDSGRTGDANLAPYAAAKAGAAGFSRCIAREVGRYGITVNCVALGTIMPHGTDPEHDRPTSRPRRSSIATSCAAEVNPKTSPESSPIWPVPMPPGSPVRPTRQRRVYSLCPLDATYPSRGFRMRSISPAMYPGGFCTLLLSDLGADVVKTEQPGAGDPVRAGADRRRLPVAPGAQSGQALDHAQREGPEAGRRTQRLVAHVDVLVESQRPGFMEAMGIGYEDLSAINPGLIWCAITGFGQHSPYAERPGHEVTYLGHAGSAQGHGRRAVPVAAPVLPRRPGGRPDGVGGDLLGAGRAGSVGQGLPGRPQHRRRRRLAVVR